MPLKVEIGYASRAGVRERNEDFLGCVTPLGGELLAKGVLAALADGMSGHAGGREAAEYAVRGLLADYYATPDTWQGTVALDRVLQALNRWVIAQSRSRPELTGMASTLTALLVRGRRMIIAHVGDTRAYRLRRGTLRRVGAGHRSQPGAIHRPDRGPSLLP